jgi:four helix bundle protein
MGARNYQDLVVWQKAMDLVELVYRTTNRFPKHEIYGLTSQIRRAAVSVPSNIAEGEGRSTSKKDFIRCLSIAYGSLRELETQALIGKRLGYADTPQTQQVLDLAAEVGRLINGLSRSLALRAE